MPMETSHPVPVKLVKKNEPSEGITLVDEQHSASCTQAVKKKKKKAVALAPQQQEQIVKNEDTDVKNEVSKKASKKKKKKKVQLADDVINVQDASLAGTKSIPAFQGSKTTYHLPTFVLVGREHANGTELSGWNMLQRSCSLNQCPLEYLCDPNEDANSKTVRIVICGQTIVTSSASNVKLAKQDVAQKAVEQLRRTQLCIIEKQVTDGSDPLKTEDILQSEHTSDNLPESNVGAKLMRLMGWSGGGVGKKAGRTDIVSTQALFGRSGLGYSGQVDQEDLRKKAQHYMAKYVNSNQEHDLIFSSDLTNEERKAIHLGVRRFSGQLKSQSYGAGQDRYLMVSRKLPKSQLVDMARHLWEQQLRTGQANPKFRVIAPLHFQPSPTY